MSDGHVYPMATCRGGIARLPLRRAQFLTILGSAGIGKTRMLVDWLHEVGHAREHKTV